MLMKNHFKTLVTLVACMSVVPAFAQMMGGPRGGMGMGGPPALDFGGSMGKLFGNNPDFTADIEMQMPGRSGGETMTVPGKIAVADGKSRFEMDMANMKGGNMPAEAASQMKAMGMDQMVTISLPKEKTTYMVYPGLQAYAPVTMRNPEAAKPESDFKIETTELGKETVDGHPCVKNKAVVTDDQGNKHESTIWNATDLHNFPVKIETQEQGRTMTMLFKDVKLTKPDASLFEPPSGYKKYDSQMALMQDTMMKQMGRGGMMMHPPQQ